MKCTGNTISMTTFEVVRFEIKPALTRSKNRYFKRIFAH